MYNYYCERDKKRKAEVKEMESVKESQTRFKRKSKSINNIEMIDELYNKYEKRVKNFVMDMVHSPIRVKDFTSPIESTRKELFEEGNKKIRGRRGFLLKGYKTEKERIEEHLRSNDYIFSPSVNHPILKDAQSSVEQPLMRYKPRTDLERIFDEVNKHSFGRANKRVIDKQLKSLNLNVAKETSAKDENCYSSNIKTGISQEEGIEEEKVLTILEKRKNRNIEAKSFLSELHLKTHFKAASVFANNIQSPRVKIKEEDPKITSSQIRMKSYGNPRRKSLTQDNLHKEELKILEAFAFSNRDTVNNQENKLYQNVFEVNRLQDKKDKKKFNFENTDNSLQKDDDKVIIGEMAIPRGRLDLIAMNILNKCNVNSSKSKNNNTSLKNGEGKLMITNGLTINQFQKKYKLN